MVYKLQQARMMLIRKYWSPDTSVFVKNYFLFKYNAEFLYLLGLNDSK